MQYPLNHFINRPCVTILHAVNGVLETKHKQRDVEAILGERRKEKKVIKKRRKKRRTNGRKETD